MAELPSVELLLDAGFGIIRMSVRLGECRLHAVASSVELSPGADSFNMKRVLAHKDDGLFRFD